MMLFWQEALESRLKLHDVAVLYGNVHDEFPTAGRLADIVAGAAQKIGCIRTQPINIAAPDAISTIEPTQGAPTCWLVENMQALFSRIDRWERETWLTYARLLEKIRGATGDRFVFIFPDEGRIPGNFLAGVPGVVRFAVPLPDQHERADWIRSADGFGEIPERDRMVLVAATAGLHWRDLAAIRHSVRAGRDPLTTIREFKFGRSKDFWAELLSDRERFATAEEKFLRGHDPIRGQDEAVKRALAVVAKACLDLTQITAPAYNRPRGVLFLVGPTGVGKTMLAKKLAELIFGSEEACLVFDMSEYSQPHSDARLIGAPPGYVGYDEGGQLTAAVRANPFSVVLFDEIDKAHPSILTKFMQVLDEGRLTDGKGQTCYFSECLIVFTSNAGALDLADNIDPRSSFVDLQRYYQQALQRAPGLDKHPEILNRIGLGNIVPFRHIIEPDHVIALIQGLFLATKRHLYAKHQTPISMDDEDAIAQAIAARAAWQQFGMRNVKQAFEIAVLEPIADAVLRAPGKALRVILDAEDIVVS